MSRSVAMVAKYPASTVGIISIFTAFGLGMVLQQSRWLATPAYGNLLIIMPVLGWGFIYLGVALCLALSLAISKPRVLSLGAHTLAFVLVASWEAAFVVRWLTDSSTTVANVVGWLVYTALVVRSATLIDGTTDPPTEE